MAQGNRVDWLTVAGLGLVLMPLLTMWHEIGGHAAACVALHGKLATIGAFYVDCEGLTGWPRRLVAMAGVSVDTLLCVVAWTLWRSMRSDFGRLLLWLIATSKGFVAAGYFLFSGVSGLGDLGPGDAGGIGPLPMPIVWRIGLALIGGLAYWQLIGAAFRGLNAMLGNSPETGRARKAIAHSYYVAQELAAVAVGLFNPVGVFILLASAAASSFGGNAGLISLGFMVPRGSDTRAFVVSRSWLMVALGVAATAGFAVVLGPSVKFE